jgi:uncharacterized protein (UPF0332 family)
LNDLENCFNRRLLRPVEPSNEKSELSIKQAREWLEEEYVLLFDRMRSARNTDQYSFQIAPSSEEVKSGIKSAGKFISRMDQLLDETTPI